jgi:hypothetical protein
LSPAVPLTQLAAYAASSMELDTLFGLQTPEEDVLDVLLVLADVLDDVGVGQQEQDPAYFKPNRRTAFSFRMSGRTSSRIGSFSKSASQRSGVNSG